MKKSRPSGLCTALYRCPKCGHERYERPNCDVTHPCPSTKNHTQLKEIKQ